MSIAEFAKPRTHVQVPAKQNVVGVNISKADYAEVVRTVRQWIAANREETNPPARYITVTSVHGIVTARGDEAVRDILNGAAIATSDGMPVVWAMRSFGVKDQQRVYGPTLMLEMCRDAAAHGHKIFLYGSSPQCIEKLSANLSAKFPRLPIAGAVSPPFRPLTAEEDADVVRMIRDSGAEIVFVGISTPKQERWMADHVAALPGTIMVGVGAAFDFHAGLLSQAPPWMQRNGLEWLYRLCAEPKRLWRRYVLETPRFLPLWALQKLGKPFP